MASGATATDPVRDFWAHLQSCMCGVPADHGMPHDCQLETGAVWSCQKFEVTQEMHDPQAGNAVCSAFSGKCCQACICSLLVNAGLPGLQLTGPHLHSHCARVPVILSRQPHVPCLLPWQSIYLFRLPVEYGVVVQRE